ncbi:MAG: glycosyltransferase [Planctomycetes bacterium]|nr:glycosyltransferase [Planctomycetota bacterium]
MRILQIVHGLLPESLGGVEVHVHAITRDLATAGHDLHVFARSSAPGQPQGTFTTERGRPSVTRVAYRWEALASFDDIQRCPPMAAALGRFLDERAAAGERFDIAHIHHLTGMSTDAVGELRQRGIPIVFTMHDYWTFCPRGQLFHPDGTFCGQVEVGRCGNCLHRTWPGLVADDEAGRAAATATHARARALFAQVDQLCVPSLRALPPLQALGVDLAGVIVVEYGIDTAAFAAVPEVVADPRRPLRIGCFGTLIPNKGIHVLVEAALKLPPGLVEIRLHGNTVSYHGDTSYLTRTFASLRAGGEVTYFGPYRPEAMPALLAEIDVIAAPALWAETYGIGVREGLRAGRAALCSRIGGLQDAVTDGVEGRVLPPGDVAAWATAMAALARDRAQVTRMGAAARRSGRPHHAVAEQLAAIYQNVCARGSRSCDPAPAAQS